jgi:hypothetical protein
MALGPTTAFRTIEGSPAALAIVERHLPGVLCDPGLRLEPFAQLGDLANRIRAVGEPLPDLSGLWQELGGLDVDPPAVPSSPDPAPDAYESGDVRRGSAAVRLAGRAEQWDCVELVLDGPAHGNPFVGVRLAATFRQEHVEIEVGGFYDGNGTYRIRFLPPRQGRWTYETASNAQSLDGVDGHVVVGPPGPQNRGRVVVHDRFHFAYEDGTPYLAFGTTAYAWIHQPDAVQEQTLQSLKSSGFSKLRMCLFPKSYVYNTREPDLFPFERFEDGSWDFTRFSMPYFAALERRVRQLMEIGVEADVILFHPYDRWGFSQMPAWADQLYIAYVVRRLAAFRNVWWSLANEYDFMKNKAIEDWEGMAEVIGREDHARHLTSIHNGFLLYDHSRDWVTHCSIQKNNTDRTATNVDNWRRFGKPVVVDEIGYEGNLPWGWGNLTAEDLVCRAWEGAVRGGYVNHGETYHSDDEIVWWSQGGTLHGQSAERFAFLAGIIAETPSGRFEPLPSDFDLLYGGDDDHRVAYFGTSRPIARSFKLPAGTWDVDLIDTWAMTVTTLPSPVEHAIDLPLPGRQYLAVRFRRRS